MCYTLVIYINLTLIVCFFNIYWVIICDLCINYHFKILAVFKKITFSNYFHSEKLCFAFLCPSCTFVWMQNKTYTVHEAQAKLEYYCSYQERCHQEVNQKLRDMGMIQLAIDHIIVHLIDNNFLDESRFACSFARGKHRIKQWGKIRIVNELKFRKISQFNINLGLKEISSATYYETFEACADKNWHSITERNIQKKRKKFCDFMLRKGFESNLIYARMKELEGF